MTLLCSKGLNHIKNISLNNIKILLRKRKLVLICFTLIVFLLSCGCLCSVSLPHSAVGWLWYFLVILNFSTYSRVFSSQVLKNKCQISTK